MFDSLFSYVIFLIPLAIFIGRFVVQAKNKNAPKPPPPRIPVHFEDDEDDDEKANDFSPYTLSHGATEYFKGLSPTPKAAQPRPFLTPGKLGERLNQQGPGDLAASVAVAEKAMAEKTSGSSAVGTMPEQNNFFARLSHLPPLKQAVIMAEVLGPPKGEQ